MAEILITGSHGLIGIAITRALVLNGYEVRRVDCRVPAGHRDYGDIRDQLLMKRVARDVDGIIHLAAVSRVHWGDADPDQCWQTNVVGTTNVVRAAAESGRNPVVIIASSREIYGEPTALPVHEDTPAAPVNLYGRSKVACEQAALAGRDAGVNTAVVRFANVYGSTADHLDRVVPAFARAASEGTTMRVCGRGQVFDFTHVDDSARGTIMLLKALLAGERNLPPVHFVTGRATTLEQLAEMAKQAGGGRSAIVEAPARANDVATFVGNPTRAEQLLDWRAIIAIEHGVRQLVDDFAGAELEPLEALLRQPAHRFGGSRRSTAGLTWKGLGPERPSLLLDTQALDRLP
jgi:nucleoside-diphosphate-sugar epimerase